VTWRLAPEGAGTRLFLEHDGFEPDNPYQRLSHQIMSGGWSAIGRKITEMRNQRTWEDIYPAPRCRVTM
jgi:hypothetical protein